MHTRVHARLFYGMVRRVGVDRPRSMRATCAPYQKNMKAPSPAMAGGAIHGEIGESGLRGTRFDAAPDVGGVFSASGMVENPRLQAKDGVR